MAHLFLNFPNNPPPPFVERAEGIWLETKDGKRLMDITAGDTHYAILGWSHPEILDAMRKQMTRFCHVDYKVWSDENCWMLADLLLTRAEHSLDKVYFCGNSGGEACEAAMKMSFQVHHDLGRTQKKWFISRTQSYHGSSTDAMAVGERPNLTFYNPLFPAERAKITEHNQYRYLRAGETLDDYARRDAKALEDKILEIGPENVCAFIGETMMGGLVGDVPPVPGYWLYMQEVCRRYDVHLILDEVYCGTGTSGKIYCCDWDAVTPDFIFMGKTLAAGYAPISAVVTSSEIEAVIREHQGRLQHSTTHQAYSLGIAAALAVQQIIHRDETLQHVKFLGEHMRARLQNELGGHPFFRNVRGRGLRFSMEVDCPDRDEFTRAVVSTMRESHSIIIGGKWHRFSFTPAFLLTTEEADRMLDLFVKTFLDIGSKWKA